ncbi:MAG: hypothetical protein U9Q79_12225, partial [Candidatus Hydrogenedentes bacterium]|nr:hypothetical protein [Candidatus Hydrogenedentota bacterium]
MLRTAFILALACIMSVCAWGQVFEEEREGLNALLGRLETSLTAQNPPLWSLFSPLGTLAITGRHDGSYIAVRRDDLRRNPDAAAAFVLPPGTTA